MRKLNNIEHLSRLETIKSEILNADNNTLRAKVLNLLTFINEYDELKTYYTQKIDLYNSLRNDSDFQKITSTLCAQIVSELNEINLMNYNEITKLLGEDNNTPITLDIDSVIPIQGYLNTEIAITNLLFYNVDNYINFLSETQIDCINNELQSQGLLSRNIWIYEQYYETCINKNNDIRTYKSSKIKNSYDSIPIEAKNSYNYFFIDNRYNKSGLDMQLKCAALSIIEDLKLNMPALPNQENKIQPLQSHNKKHPTRKQTLTYNANSQQFYINRQLLSLEPQQVEVLKSISGVAETNVTHSSISSYSVTKINDKAQNKLINRKKQGKYSINSLEYNVRY